MKNIYIPKKTRWRGYFRVILQSTQQHTTADAFLDNNGGKTFVKVNNITDANLSLHHTTTYFIDKMGCKISIVWRVKNVLKFNPYVCITEISYLNGCRSSENIMAINF